MEYYVSTTGLDTNPGTIDKPFRNIERLQPIDFLPGDIGFIRAGTYLSTAPASQQFCLRLAGKNGTPAQRIKIAAYPADFINGGRVLFDTTNITHTQNCYAITTQNCSYIDFIGIYVKGINQAQIGTGTITGSFWSIDCSNNQYINCEGSHCMTGFRLDGGANTSFINCDSHDCDDPFTGPPTGAHNNSDGFGRWNIANTATNTLYKGCRSWNNGDDGFDVYDSNGTVTFDTCWSFRNGKSAGGATLGDGNGFKLGGTNSKAGLTRFIRFCIASGNTRNGYDQNAGFFTAQFYNNSAYACGNNDWKFGYNPPIAHQFRNNLSYKCTITDGFTTDANAWNPNDHNTWNGITLADSDFVSLDESQLLKPRKPNGDLPDITFLKPATAKLIDKGVNVGLPFSGTAPDIGAIEAGTVTPPTPTVYKNVAQSKSFTKNNCTSGIGSSVMYIIPAGKYTSNVSQAAADQLATDDINNNGQNYANLNGTCTAKTITKVVIYYSDGTTVTQQ